MKNQYKITKPLIMSWAKEYHLRGAANIFSFVLWCFIGLISLALLALYATNGGDWLDWYISILFLFVSVFKLFFSRFVIWSKRYKMYSNTYGVTEWLRTTEFLDDEIVITDHTSVTKFKYDKIAKIAEKNNVVMIFCNNNLAIRFYKDAFVEGTWEDCKKMLEDKIK